MASPADIQVLVSQSDFDRALAALVPSVSQAEMNHYAQIQHRFARKPEKYPVHGHKDSQGLNGDSNVKKALHEPPMPSKGKGKDRGF